MHTIAASITCLMLLGIVPPIQTAPEAAGFVVDLSGRWDVVRPAPSGLVAVKRTDVVNAGDTLQKHDDDPAAFIVVALYSGTMQKYTVSTRVMGRPATGPIARILSAIQQRFQEGWISASVRGGADFHDTIVRAAADRTDVSAVFAGADPGAYAVTAYAIERGRIVTTPRVTARVSIGRGAITIPALLPGLYQLDVSNGPVGSDGSAWIRVVAPDRYDAAAREFAQLPGAGDTGGAEMRKAARAVARTYLLVFDDATSAKR